ncbi:hypothetical protein ERO13_1Z049829v2 [Gossypium hirsutum]|nr:hypothetical protein ERO13_1Z049829v2 [Gossypium hirsutum]
MAESAIAALNCSGAILGSLPIRVSPSKNLFGPVLFTLQCSETPCLCSFNWQ